MHHKQRAFLINGSTTLPMSTSENINLYATFSSTRLPLSGFTHGVIDVGGGADFGGAIGDVGGVIEVGGAEALMQLVELG
jgi:hypothetical protein